MSNNILISGIDMNKKPILVKKIPLITELPKVYDEELLNLLASGANTKFKLKYRSWRIEKNGVLHNIDRAAVKRLTKSGKIRKEKYYVDGVKKEKLILCENKCVH